MRKNIKRNIRIKGRSRLREKRMREITRILKNSKKSG